MQTVDLFREDAYLKTCEAEVVAADERGLVLDRTVFYATGGGQPGDQGAILTAAGASIPIANAVYGEGRSEIIHVVADNVSLPMKGETVTATLDWDRRYRMMRMHTCLHLLSAVLPYPVTGGQIGPDEGRLDFDIPEASIDRDEVSEKLAAMIAGDHAVTMRWITDEELLANPGLVKTMAVKPPMGSGRVRLVEIEGCDLQPCGGTHVARTAEIGGAAVTRIEKKGAKNRRVRIALLD